VRWQSRPRLPSGFDSHDNIELQYRPKYSYSRPFGIVVLALLNDQYVLLLRIPAELLRTLVFVTNGDV
jgi:hypothetical protein